MKVLVAKEPGIAEYVELPKPTPEDDQVILKLYRNGVCGTDLEILDGSAFFMNNGSTQYPVRFGHEFSGVITEVGKNVKNFKVGEHVVGDGAIFCGKCPECLAGNWYSCQHLRSVGTIDAWPGSYAEYMVLPERNLFHLPEGLSHDNAALIEPAAIGMAGIDKCNIIPGESIVLITGVGAIGLACAAFAKWKGAKQVIVSGRTPYKLDIAKKLGADYVINPKEEDLVKVVKEITNGHGADCILECSGSISVIDDCLEVLAQRGIFAVIAFYGRKYETFDIDTFVLRDAEIKAVTLHDFENTIKALEDGVDLSPLITRHVKFDEAADFLMQQIKQKTSDIKVVINIAD